VARVAAGKTGQIMYPSEMHHRFIELRVQGWSLDRIAAELHVAKRTLIHWQRQYQRDITDLRGLELEAAQNRILASHEQELSRLAAQLEQVEAVLAKRRLDCLSTEFLFCLAGSLRAQLRKLRVTPTLAPASPASDVAASATPPPPAA
jgi:transposase